MKMFHVRENNKVYNVSVRGAFRETITCERKLRDVVAKSIASIYGENANQTHSIFEMCDILGILQYRCPIEK